MTFTFKKFSKNLRRTVSGALCLIVLSSLLVIPAGAVERSLDIVWSMGGDGYTSTMSPIFGRNTPVDSRPLPGDSSGTVYYWANLDRVTFDSSEWTSGAVGIYFSYYCGADNSGVRFVDFPTAGVEGIVLRYTDDVGALQSLPVSVSRFTPIVDPNVVQSVSPGIRLKVTLNVPDYSPISDPYIFNGIQYGKVYCAPSASYVSLYVPSVSLVISDSPENLAALEGVADSIAQQSQILDAMYGDIMSILNDMYIKLGSIEAAAQLANSYFSQMIPLLNGINTNTSNIYSLLQTQFQLLRTLIATESDDIQAAIEQQTDDLIAYFDTVFSDAVGDMPEKTDDLNQSVGDVSDAESNYQSTATQRFDQLTDTFSGGFSGGTLAGVTLAATLFSRVWNALGDYVIVYTWPLFLGLCLVILGRMSRLSGGQSSSEKHRGDSDA